MCACMVRLLSPWLSNPGLGLMRQAETRVKLQMRKGSHSNKWSIQLFPYLPKRTRVPNLHINTVLLLSQPLERKESVQKGHGKPTWCR
jgi:hypothetical protein